jgi:methyl-accepting chemotaxis protein
MILKSIFKLPQLKLRGTIIAAAAAVFTVAIGATLYYVVSTNRAQDLLQADEVVAGMAETEASEINVFLSQYASAADSVARTASALLAEPTAGAALYGSIVSQQLSSLPDALGVYVMFSPESGLAARPDFAGSPFILSNGYFGAYATRDSKTGEIVHTSLDSGGAEGFKAWFDGPLAQGVPQISGPDNYDGVLYTSFTNVIRNPAGKAVGMSGVSFSGNQLATLIGGEDDVPGGFMGVVNQKGAWVVNPDPAMVGRPADEPWAKDAVTNAAGGEMYHSTGEAAGVVWKLTAARVDLVGTEDSWRLIVALPRASLLAASEAQLVNLLIGGAIILVLGLIAFALLGTSVARPVARMNAVMRKIAEDDYSIEVPYASRKDEIGDMAKAVEVFRQNGLKVAQMTEAEAARIIRDQEVRAEMMAALQQSFGDVVDAAVAGDFSKRVEAEFSDAELNGLAASINNLVQTVDAGLAETSTVLSSIARAELTGRVVGSYSGAFGRLKDDTNAVAEKLTEIVGQLKETSRTLKTATSEILSGANDLSERTTKQAATIEETSATMEQLATTVLQNAERARDASNNAGQVTRTAEEGGAVMAEATQAMERITTSSGKISNIIGLIDDIAFQTNLLALNASPWWPWKCGVSPSQRPRPPRRSRC